MMTLTYPTLLETLWPARRSASPVARNAALALAGSLLLAISAKLHIPFWPVPLTMQTFVVLVLGMAFGWKLGAATMLLYLAEGAIGLPVFSGTPERGLGLAYMAGPTGGYLVGFVAGAALCGSLAHKGILALGWAWLATFVGPAKAYALGVVPFYAATVAKTALAVVALPLAWKLTKKP